MKMLPVLVMVGGVAAVGANGKKFISRVTNKVKVLLTGMEVMNIGDELRFHFLSSGTIAGDGGPEAFAEFLRQNFKPSWGARDPAYDLWNNLYEMTEGEGADERVVFSLGPNGTYDDCAVVNGEPVPFDVMELDPANIQNIHNMDAAESMGEDAELMNGEEYMEYIEGMEGVDEEEIDAMMPDDICITLEFALRDTPFRPIPQ